MSKKTVLITGVAGMMGSNMARWILKNKPEFDVIGIDDLSGGYEEYVPKGIRFLDWDCSDPNIKSLFEDENYNITHVFHFAAYAAECASPFLRKFNYTNNLVSTANIVNLCIKYKAKLLFTSSMAVYGDILAPFKETDVCQPKDPYGVAKLACEMDIEIAKKQHGLKAVVFRPHNVVGYNQNIWDKYRNVIGIWSRQLINNEPITIFGDGEQRRAFTWIDDCLPVFWEGIEQGHGTYNVGSNFDVSINEVAKTLVEIAGKGEIVYLPGRHEVKNAHSLHILAKEQFGFECSTPTTEIVERLWNWAQTQPNRKVKVWDEFEITDGLYEYWK